MAGKNKRPDFPNGISHETTYIVDSADTAKTLVVRNRYGDVVFDMTTDPFIQDYRNAVREFREKNPNATEEELKTKPIQILHEMRGPYDPSIDESMNKIDQKVKQIAEFSRVMPLITDPAQKHTAQMTLLQMGRELDELKYKDIEAMEVRGLKPENAQRFKYAKAEIESIYNLPVMKGSQEFYKGNHTPEEIERYTAQLKPLYERIGELDKECIRIREDGAKDRTKSENYAPGSYVCEQMAIVGGLGVYEAGIPNRVVGGLHNDEKDRGTEANWGHTYIQTKDSHIIEATDPKAPIRYNFNEGSLLLGDTIVTLNPSNGKLSTYGTGRISRTDEAVASLTENVIDKAAVFDAGLMAKFSKERTQMLIEGFAEYKKSGKLKPGEQEEFEKELAKLQEKDANLKQYAEEIGANKLMQLKPPEVRSQSESQAGRSGP